MKTVYFVTLHRDSVPVEHHAFTHLFALGYNGNALRVCNNFPDTVLEAVLADLAAQDPKFRNVIINLSKKLQK